MIITLVGINFTGTAVFLNGKKLNPEKSQEIINHSPDGFSWGYEGSGCAQLALAILLELTDKETAVSHYQRFKRDVIANLKNDFQIEIDVTEYVGCISGQEPFLKQN